MKSKFLSIPGDPAIPGLVRAYGTIIRLVNATVIIVNIVWMIVSWFVVTMDDAQMAQAAQTMKTTYTPQHGAFYLMVFVCLVQIVISGILFSVGKFVRNGYKKGIHTLTAVAIFQVIIGIVSIVMAKKGGAIIGESVIVGTAIILGPPIAVAYKNWEKFH